MSDMTADQLWTEMMQHVRLMAFAHFKTQGPWYDMSRPDSGLSARLWTHLAQVEDADGTLYSVEGKFKVHEDGKTIGTAYLAIRFYTADDSEYVDKEFRIYIGCDD